MRSQQCAHLGGPRIAEILVDLDRAQPVRAGLVGPAAAAERVTEEPQRLRLSWPVTDLPAESHRAVASLDRPLMITEFEMGLALVGDGDALAEPVAGLAEGSYRLPIAGQRLVGPAEQPQRVADGVQRLALAIAVVKVAVDRQGRLEGI